MMDEYEVWVVDYLLRTIKTTSEERRIAQRHPLEEIEWWRIDEVYRTTILPYVLSLARQNP